MDILPAGQLPQNPGCITTKELECYDCSGSLGWELCWRMVLCVLWGTASLSTRVSHLHLHYGSSMYVQPYKILLHHVRSGVTLDHATLKFTISLRSFAVVVNACFIAGPGARLNRNMLLGAGRRVTEARGMVLTAKGDGLLLTLGGLCTSGHWTGLEWWTRSRFQPAGSAFPGLGLQTLSFSSTVSQRPHRSS